jgi:Family of unknown function (DUF5678)
MKLDQLMQYAGQWIALDGERLIAAGPSLRDVVHEARRKGVAVPYVFHVERTPEDVATIGL